MTHYYINIYTMIDNQEREEVHIGNISDDSMATEQERRTRLYDRFLFLEKNDRQEAAAEIANWTVKQGVETTRRKDVWSGMYGILLPGVWYIGHYGFR